MRSSGLLFLVTSLFAAAPEWPQFRGPNASGTGSGSPVTEWDGATGRNILWKMAIPGLGLSSPVIVGDRIFLTSAVPESGSAGLKVGLYGDIQPVKDEGVQHFRVYAIDRATGKIVWERTAATGKPKVMRHPKSSHANPTPATDGRHLVVSFGSEGLFCYSISGNLLWKKDLGLLDAGYYLVPGAQWGYASSPVIADGKVIVLADVQKDSFLAAFDVATGKEVWRTARKDVPTFGSPAVVPGPAAGEQQVVVNGWKQMAGYDLATGKERWTLPGGGDIPVPTPVFADGLILITNAHGQRRPIFAIRADGTVAWTEERAGNYMQTPMLADGLGYFCYDLGVLSVYELKTGTRVYQQRLQSDGAGYSASSVAAGGRLYLTSEEGRTHVIALGREYKALAQNELGETVMATPALAGDVIYMRGGHHLFAIGAKK